MILWTDTVPIPQIEFCSAPGLYRVKRNTAVINGKIWFVYGEESSKVSQVDIPISLNYWCESVASDGIYLYLYLRNKSGYAKLNKYDTELMENVDITNINFTLIPRDFQVIDDFFIFLSVGRQIPLTRYDLRHKALVRTHSMIDDDREIGNIIRNNDDLHLLTFNRKEIEVSTIYAYESRITTKTPRIKRKGLCNGIFLTNGTMLTRMTKQEEQNNEVHNVSELVVETFDFENRTWQQDVVEDFFKYEENVSLLAVEHVKDKIYVFTHISENPNQVVIRVLNLKPTLAEICLLNITKCLLSGKERMPLGLRNQLGTMIKSRVPSFGF